MRVHIKISWYCKGNVERGLKEVEADCVAAGLESEGATYEPGYPIYGWIDDSLLQRIASVDCVTWIDPVEPQTPAGP